MNAKKQTHVTIKDPHKSKSIVFIQLVGRDFGIFRSTVNNKASDTVQYRALMSLTVLHTIKEKMHFVQ